MVGALVAPATIGVAAAAQPQTAQTNVQQAPMTSHQVTAAEPSNDGGALATLDNGAKLRLTPQQYRAWQTAPQRGQQPLNTVPGSCGTSSVYLTGLPDGFAFTTGYNITGDIFGVNQVWYASWGVYVTGNTGYEHTFDFSGGRDLDNEWSNGGGDSAPNGSYTASVNGISSFVVLVDGSVCTSNGPSDLARVGPMP